jgi:hypothetical protein
MSLKYDWFIVVFLSLKFIKIHPWNTIHEFNGWLVELSFMNFSWMNNIIFMSMKCQDEIKIHEIIFKFLFHPLMFNQIPQEVQINKMCQIYNWHPSNITTNTLFCLTNLWGLLPRMFSHKFSHKILFFTLQVRQLVFKIISHGP